QPQHTARRARDMVEIQGGGGGKNDTGHRYGVGRDIAGGEPPGRALYRGPVADFQRPAVRGVVVHGPGPGPGGRGRRKAITRSTRRSVSPRAMADRTGAVRPFWSSAAKSTGMMWPVLLFSNPPCAMKSSM